MIRTILQFEMKSKKMSIRPLNENIQNKIMYHKFIPNIYQIYTKFIPNLYQIYTKFIPILNKYIQYINIIKLSLHSLT